MLTQSRLPLAALEAHTRCLRAMAAERTPLTRLAKLAGLSPPGARLRGLSASGGHCAATAHRVRVLRALWAFRLAPAGRGRAAARVRGAHGCLVIVLLGLLGLFGQAGPPPEAGTWYTIGQSVEGRPIQAVRLGGGPVRLALMGSIHGGWEANTQTLVQTAYTFFVAHPEAIPDGLSVYFVPTTNPDGLAAGSGRDAAWNAHGVDLNRNFETPNWSTDSFGQVGGRYGPSGTRAGAGGPAPFSEPETQAIRDFVLGERIDAVLSYHSGIVSVTSRDGGDDPAQPLAEQVAAITGYPYIKTWTAYRLTGQFMDWLSAVGCKGIEVDLPNQQDIDWDKNLAAIEAVMAALQATGPGT